MQLTGIHHITAVSGKIANNVDFYTRVLGLRLVKKSVNQDDISAYHLFYADRIGSPGTDMTFFDWPQIGPNQRGTDSIAGTAFRVAGQEALDYWISRLEKNGARDMRLANFAGRDLLAFDDPEGQRLYLVDDQGAEFEGEIWTQPDIPDEFTLRGFYSSILSVPSFDHLDQILTQVLRFVEVKRAFWIDGQTPAVIYQTRINGGPGAEVWVLEEPELVRAHLGAGGVHHVAFRVPDKPTQAEWRSSINHSGLRITPVINRHWFHSIYFRVSNGILFEIATDGPGFSVDEAIESLGQKLVLPPFLEDRRDEIEAGLTPIDKVNA